jgi:hypothetical protein
MIKIFRTLATKRAVPVSLKVMSEQPIQSPEPAVEHELDKEMTFVWRTELP